TVASSPAGARSQPDGERLREVLVRVLLGVGSAVAVVNEMADEPPAKRVGPKVITVGLAKGPKQLDPFGRLVQHVGVADGMAGLVPQQHHAVLGVFDLACLLLLDTGEALGKEVKRHANYRHFVRAAPAVGGINLGTKAEAFGTKFAVQPPNVRFDGRALDLEAQFANARIEQLVANRFPTVDKLQRTRRGHRCSGDRIGTAAAHLTGKQVPRPVKNLKGTAFRDDSTNPWLTCFRLRKESAGNASPPLYQVACLEMYATFRIGCKP